MAEKLPEFIAEGQPELQAVINQLVAAINSLQTLQIEAGEGIRITRSGNSILISNSKPELTPVRKLYPFIGKKAGVSGVGLTPGYVLYPRRELTSGLTNSLATSIQRMPYLGTDEVDHALDTDLPPVQALTAGEYYTWLLISEDKVRVKFIELGTADEPEHPQFAYALAINKFTLQDDPDSGQIITEVEVYDDQPRAEYFQRRQFFKVAISDEDFADEENPVYKVIVQEGKIRYMDATNVGNGQSAVVTSIFSSVSVSESDELTVANGDSIWLVIECNGDSYRDGGTTSSHYYDALLQTYDEDGIETVGTTVKCANMRVRLTHFKTVGDPAYIVTSDNPTTDYRSLFGTYTGTFAAGETITQATSGATATVGAFAQNGTTNGGYRLIVKDVTGTPNATDLWTGGDSGATLTPADSGQPGGLANTPLTTIGFVEIARIRLQPVPPASDDPQQRLIIDQLQDEPVYVGAIAMPFGSTSIDGFTGDFPEDDGTA
jgi:hypothetical protein